VSLPKARRTKRDGPDEAGGGGRSPKARIFSDRGGGPEGGAVVGAERAEGSGRKAVETVVDGEADGISVRIGAASAKNQHPPRRRPHPLPGSRSRRHRRRTPPRRGRRRPGPCPWWTAAGVERRSAGARRGPARNQRPLRPPPHPRAKAKMWRPPTPPRRGGPDWNDLGIWWPRSIWNRKRRRSI